MTRKDIRDLAIVVGAFLFLVAVVAGVVFAIIALGKHTAAWRGGAAATEQVQSGPFRLSTYNNFFSQCASVQGKEAAITALRQELGTNPPPDRVTQINASLTALRATRAQAVADYNADAAKTGTAAQFLASNLPTTLNADQEKTVCAR